jgi:hypothetical protein
MKTRLFKYAIITVLLSLLFQACEDVLNPLPQTTISPENVFSSAGGIKAALVTCYANESFWAAYYSTMVPDEYGNPDVSEGGDNASTIAMSHGTITPTSEIVNSGWESFWSGFYKSVNYCNFLIENEDKFANISEADKKTVLAEAKFIRAKAYYLLVNFFGDVPLLTHTFTSLATDRFPKRNPVSEVYQQIIDDLEYGVANLSPGPFDGHVKKGAAEGLLAKAYMSAPSPLKDYLKAEGLTKSIIQSGVYALEANYDDLWYHANKTKFSKTSECIYGCILSSLVLNGGGHVQFLASPKSPAPWFIPRKSFVGEFISWKDTIRLKSTFMFINELPYTTGYYLYKFMNSDWRTNLIAQGKGEPNDYFLRYADILLLRAEILNEINNGPTQEAIDLVNQIRNRAKIIPLSLANYPDKETFLTALIKERKHELIFEGHLFFDLKRMGKATQYLYNMTDNGTKTTNFQDYQLLFPIPERDLSVNTSLTQNYGY